MPTLETSPKFTADPGRVFKIIAEIISGREEVKITLKSVSKKKKTA